MPSNDSAMTRGHNTHVSQFPDCPAESMCLGQHFLHLHRHHDDYDYDDHSDHYDENSPPSPLPALLPLPRRPPQPTRADDDLPRKRIPTLTHTHPKCAFPNIGVLQSSLIKPHYRNPQIRRVQPLHVLNHPGPRQTAGLAQAFESLQLPVLFIQRLPHGRHPLSNLRGFQRLS